MTNETLIKKAEAIDFWPFSFSTLCEIEGIKYKKLDDKIQGFVYPLEKYGLEEDDIRFKALQLGATMIADYHRRDDVLPALGLFYWYEGVPVKPVDSH